MTDLERLPTPQPKGDFDAQALSPNALGLNEDRLHQVASHIRDTGITRQRLIEIASRKLTDDNPLLSHLVGNTIDDIQRYRKDPSSFIRGATLALHLIDEASVSGAPIMGIGSSQLAFEYRNKPPTLEGLRIASDGLLASQASLSAAFDEALTGMPEGTEPEMARFGAGIVTLGAMAAAQFGGTGTEVWFDPDQP